MQIHIIAKNKIAKVFFKVAIVNASKDVSICTQYACVRKSGNLCSNDTCACQMLNM